MRKCSFFNVILTTSLLVFGASYAASANENLVDAPSKNLPFETIDGLQKVDSAIEGRVVYLKSDVDFSQFKYIQILKAHVAFSKNWQADFNRKNRATIGVVTDEDIIKIKQNVSKNFDEAFKAEFNHNGYPVIEVAKEHTLLIRPALVDLDLVNPSTVPSTNTKTFSRDDESVTLYIELYDGITGEILARVAENKYITENEYYGWQNRSRNSSDMVRLLKDWASELRMFLDNSHDNHKIKSQ